MVFGASDDAARVIAAAEAVGKPSVLFVQSNADVDPRLLTDAPPVHPYGDTAQGRRWAIERATAVVCQSRWQLNVLEEHFHRTGILIRNPIDRAEWLLPKDLSEPYVLWVGRYDNFHKRPALMLDVARRCPAIPFRMVINVFDQQVQRDLMAGLPPNVAVRSYVPFAQMPAVFRGAAAFVSTGDPAYEGFPNVLLQSAASHTPIFSLHDYDGFLASSGSGIVCPDVPSMAEALEQFWHRRITETGTEDRSPRWGAVGPSTIDWERSDRYLDAHHDAQRIARAASGLFERLIAQHGGPGVPASEDRA